MTKSLNQAFIKAYSKEKAQETQRHAEVERLAEAQRKNSIQELSDSLIMRFDTATMTMPVPPPRAPEAAAEPRNVAAETLPTPHFLQERPRAVQAVRSHAAPAHQASVKRELEPAATQSAARAESLVSSDSPEAVRDSIASQMLRAGQWGDQQLDVFLGGFPMLPEAVSAAPTAPATQAPTPAATTTPAPTLLEPTAPAPTPTVAPQAPVPVTSQAALPQQPQAQQPQEMGIAHADEQVEAPTPAPTSSGTLPRVLVSPEAPAISTHQTSEGRSSLREGEIFRLDRPTYSAAPGPAEADLDSGEQSSVLGIHTSSHENLEAEASPTAPALDTREIEEKLRRSKIRVFNPAWEVDNLQWPEICIELLAHTSSHMELVAQNLVAASQEGLQIMAVTSSDSGEGRTTVACCLAILAGTRGLKVAIVDGDLENPTLAYQTNLDVEQDWRTALLHHLPLEEVAVHSIDDQVTLIPLLEPVGQSELSPDDDRIAGMLQELSESFDLVIVDMGHMNSARSLVATMGEYGLISATVAVVDHRQATQQSIENCLRKIRESGVASVGLVENFAA
ncbi:nucleotide-binding protein [Aureliella helgolandensis]|uniref:CobQ/CobB/MinD/ParA nucleotide binding domain protein n=1 Tax=Aureliella helgolandensis TaxID=2527968 RepID=A0A518GFY9_9BACT|nr:cellulose synthase operon protein YhjQ/BcsQ [Aureliella helgolandensis]QDV27511.1 CobQ/CobB/MinD/ParA nucleotide binding domain protein [Aureliella helgolandensis]